MSGDLDATAKLISACSPLIAEMESRLEGEVSEADLLAARTAVAKALLRGYREGFKDALFAVEMKGRRAGLPPIDLAGQHELHMDATEPDPWAEDHEDDNEGSTDD